jgi:hypothetical protein
MNGFLNFFLVSIYGNAVNNTDDLGVFLYTHNHRDDGVEFNALRQLFLNLQASGLRGQRLRDTFRRACQEINEAGAITNLTPHEGSILYNMMPPAEEEED